MIKDAGCAYVILGHSERRQFYGETDALVQKKALLALGHGLTPIVCVGETEEERERGDTERKLRHQVQEGLERLSPEQIAQVTVAYEPIWAIGTGRVATPEQAQDAIAFVRALIADAFSAGAAVQVLPGVDVPDGWMQLDIGPKSRTAYVAEIRKARTIFWNGPIGAFEFKPFAAGSLAVAQAMAQSDATTVVGGGDSGAAMAEFGLGHSVTHLSTGGGASMKLIEGATLPGLEALGG
jgi:hypothetical protein